MSHPSHTSVLQKVLSIFEQLAPNRFKQLRGDQLPNDATSAMASALMRNHPPPIARDVAFHLSDWNSDAAFLVAVLLFPERFTPDELVAGIDQLLSHAPNHLAAAAKLSGSPITDVFGVGNLLGNDKNASRQ